MYTPRDLFLLAKGGLHIRDGGARVPRCLGHSQVTCQSSSHVSKKVEHPPEKGSCGVGVRRRNVHRLNMLVIAFNAGNTQDIVVELPLNTNAVLAASLKSEVNDPLSLCLVLFSLFLYGPYSMR